MSNEAWEAVLRYRLALPEGARESFDRAAPYYRYLRTLEAGYITQEQFDAAAKRAGDNWHYTGD